MREPIDLKITTASAIDVAKAQLLFPDWTFVQGPLSDQELAAKQPARGLKLWILTHPAPAPKPGAELILYLHHVIVDGWSLLPLLREIQQIFEAASNADE
jgi:hypothetical protein